MDLSIFLTAIDSTDFLNKLFEQYDKFGGDFYIFSSMIFNYVVGNQAMRISLEDFLCVCSLRNIQFKIIENLVFHLIFDTNMGHINIQQILPPILHNYGPIIFKSPQLLYRISNVLAEFHINDLIYLHENIPFDILQSCISKLHLQYYTHSARKYLQWITYVNENICSLEKIELYEPDIEAHRSLVQTNFLKIAYKNNWIDAFEYLLSIGYTINNSQTKENNKLDKYTDLLVSNGWTDRQATQFLMSQH